MYDEAMDLEEELNELDQAITDAQLELARRQADLDALRARRDSLRRSSEELARQQLRDERARDIPFDERWAAVDKSPLNWEGLSLRGQQRTDAIIAILNHSPRPLRIPEVVEALNATTLEAHEYQVVASTLAFLTRGGRIVNPSRGLYRRLPKVSPLNGAVKADQ